MAAGATGASLGILGVAEVFGQQGKSGHVSKDSCTIGPNGIESCNPPPQPPPCTWGAACNVSQSAVSDAISTFVNAYNKLKAGTVQATDLSSAYTAAQMMFSNFQDAGLYTDMQDRINSCSNDSSCANPVSASVINSLYTKLVGYGANITTSEVQQYLTFSASLKSATITQFNQLGMPSIANTTEQSVDNAAIAMESTGTYVTSEATVGATCYEFGLIIDTLELLAALYGAAVLLGCIPCAAIAAVLLIFAGVLHLIADAFCR